MSAAPPPREPAAARPSALLPCSVEGNWVWLWALLRSLSVFLPVHQTAPCPPPPLPPTDCTLQEGVAPAELLAQAGAVREAWQGPRATDIGLGLPGGW